MPMAATIPMIFFGICENFTSGFSLSIFYIGLNLSLIHIWTAQQLAVMSGRGLALSCDVTLDGRFLRKVQVDHPLAVMPLYLSWASKWKMSGAALYVRDYYLQLAQRKGGELVF